MNKKPIRSSYKTQAGFDRALKKWNDSNKPKNPVKKKPVAKKPATKKPPVKKPAAKKPVAKKPAVKVPAKKPLISNKQKLQIKKAATTAADTTNKIVKKGVEQSKKVASNVKGKVDEVRQVKQRRSPAPKTPQQKFVSKTYKGAKKYAGKVYKKAGQDLFGKQRLLKIRNLKGLGKQGLAGLAAAGAASAINRRVDSAFAKQRGMSLDEYRKARKEFSKGKGIGSLTKKLIKKVRGKSGESSATRNINKQKKANTLPNRGLKVKKTRRSSRKNTNKDYNAPTATKKADKRFSTFRVNPDENLKLQLERQKGNTETYSRKLSPQAKKTKRTVRTDLTNNSPKPGSARAKMRAKNEARFGKAHVDKLRAKNRDFQLMRKKKMTKAEFIRRYPNSQTAKRARGL